MEITLFSVLTIGFILGIKHAIEPDHVIAVSTIASKSKKLWHASLAGVFWGIGHTSTLFIIGILLILMKNDIVGQMVHVIGISCRNHAFLFRNGKYTLV